MGRSKSDVNNNIKKIIGERVRLLRGDISRVFDTFHLKNT